MKKCKIKFMRCPENGHIVATHRADIFNGYEVLDDKEGMTLFIKQFSESIKGIDKIYCVLRTKGANGMSRSISFFVITNEKRIRSIDFEIGIICDYKNHEKGGLIVSGCGMDMGLHVVNTLEYKLNLDNPLNFFKHEWI